MALASMTQRLLGAEDLYSTGQVAKICRVAPHTVSKWFDAGTLRGYRLPGSQDRRILKSSLVEFLSAHRLPLPREFLPRGTLVVSAGAALACVPGCETAATWLAAGIALAARPWACLVLDAAAGSREACEALAHAASTPCPPRTVVIAYDGGTWPADLVIPGPATPDAVLAAVAEAT